MDQLELVRHATMVFIQRGVNVLNLKKPEIQAHLQVHAMLFFGNHKNLDVKIPTNHFVNKS